jgi:hypothetical protein
MRADRQTPDPAPRSPWSGTSDGDGFGDLVIGAPSYDQNYANEGLAELHRGGPNGVYNYVSWSGAGGQASALYGSSVAGAGDVNGDGYNDVIVGAPSYTDSHTLEGKTFVYTGSSAGLSPAAAWTYLGGQTGAALGRSVASAGDVNGDGYGDVIIGADYYDNGQTNEGRALVFLGTPGGLSTSPAWSAEGDQVGATFGHVVACAGDLNGDGFSDVIVGAPSFDNEQTDEGRAYVYLGSPSGLSTTPIWTAEGNQASAFFGEAVAGAGDVNGDGYSDIVVGAPNYDLSDVDEGKAVVYLGGPGGPALTPVWSGYGSQAGAHLGVAAACGGDVNGDGRSDLLLGASGYDNDSVDDGRAYLYLGTATGPKSYPDWVSHGSQAGELYGCALSGSGDVNGDGFADLLVGAYNYSNGETAEGAAFFHFGNGRDGLDRTPGQWRADDGRRIALLGKSESSSSFRLHLLGRTPAGRGRVRLAWEVKPFGTPFDGSGVRLGIMTDTGAPVVNRGSSAPLDVLADGLNFDTKYCWRVRLQTDSPFFPRSLWLSHPGNNRTEMDLRTAGGSSTTENVRPDVPVLPRVIVTPNPASGPCAVVMELPVASDVRLTVVDLEGRRIATLLEGRMEAGLHTASWNGRGNRGERLAAGVYFAHLQTSDGRTQATKVIRIGR